MNGESWLFVIAFALGALLIVLIFDHDDTED
jgi:hypothetical protein